MLVLLTLLIVPPSLPQQTTIADYGWRDFSPGAFVRLKIKTISSYGLAARNSEVETTRTLIKKTNKGAEIEEVVVENGRQVEKKRLIVPLLVAADFIHAKQKRIEQEVVKVMDFELPCVTVEYHTKYNGKKARRKLWLSPEIPGGIAKSFLITEGDEQTVRIGEVDFYDAFRNR